MENFVYETTTTTSPKNEYIANKENNEIICLSDLKCIYKTGKCQLPRPKVRGLSLN